MPTSHASPESPELSKTADPDRIAAVLWWHRAHREEVVQLLIGVLAFSVIMIGLSNLGREDGAFADYPAEAFRRAVGVRAPQ
jgi:hypothetical protein